MIKIKRKCMDRKENCSMDCQCDKSNSGILGLFRRLFPSKKKVNTIVEENRKEPQMLDDDYCNCSCHNPKKDVLHVMPCCDSNRKRYKVR